MKDIFDKEEIEAIYDRLHEITLYYNEDFANEVENDIKTLVNSLYKKIEELEYQL